MKKVLMLLLILVLPITVFAAPTKVVDYIQGIANTAGGDDSTNNVIGDTDLAYDGTVDKNLRYVGKNPNNYVIFNNELWRIIGVMNNIEDANGVKASRVKIFRNETIGEYSYDSSAADIGGGRGSNEWSRSYANRILNTYYYLSQKGICAIDKNLEETECDFTETGLSAVARSQIETVKWNDAALLARTSGYSVKETYPLERNSSTTDTREDPIIKTREATWIANIGLINPTDFAFSTSGTDNTVRNSCLNTAFVGCALCSNNWAKKYECGSNTWFPRHTMWSLNGSNSIYYSSGAVTLNFYYSSHYVYGKTNYHPVVYLKDDVMIYGGTGTAEDPYILEVYDVTVEDVKAEDVNITPSDKDLPEGTIVTITSLNSKKKIKSITILDENNQIVDYTKVDDTHYQFKMPNSNVKVQFKYENDISENPKTLFNLIIIVICFSLCIVISVITQVTLRKRKGLLS